MIDVLGARANACPNYFIDDYQVGPKVITPNDSGKLTYLQKVFNRTILSPPVIDSTFLASAGLMIFISKHVDKTFDEEYKDPPWCVRHINYVDKVCHMSPLDYIQDHRIPLIQKVFDLVIGVPVAGVIEITGLTLLPFVSVPLILSALLVTLTLVIPMYVFCRALCCVQEDPQKLSDKAITEAFNICTTILFGSCVGTPRAALKLFPIIGPALVKTFDMGLLIFGEFIGVTCDGVHTEVGEFVGSDIIRSEEYFQEAEVADDGEVYYLALEDPS